MHRCCLSPGQRGICLARKNSDGRIVCDNYGMVTSLALDPIEKAFENVPLRKPSFIRWELRMQFKMSLLPESRNFHGGKGRGGGNSGCGFSLP